MIMRLSAIALAVIGGVAALAASADSQAANIGYMNTCGVAQPAHATAITAAGHTPVAVATPDAAALSGLATLSVVNCSNSDYAASWTSNLAAVTAAVNAGMTLVFHDRRVVEANAMMPGGAGLATVGQSLGSAVDIPAGSPILSGPGGALNDASLDGGNFSTHGYTTALPAGGSIYANDGNVAHGVTVTYPYGAGKVVYSSIPLDFYLGGGGNNPPRDNIVNIYLPNLLAATSGNTTTCASSGYTYTQLSWCQNICERGYTGATLNVWIRRWIERYRVLPYCAAPPPSGGS